MRAGFPSLLSVALIKHPDQKKLGERRVYSDLEARAEAETMEEFCLRNLEPPAQGQHSPQYAVHPHIDNQSRKYTTGLPTSQSEGGIFSIKISLS